MDNRILDVIASEPWEIDFVSFSVSIAGINSQKKTWNVVYESNGGELCNIPVHYLWHPVVILCSLRVLRLIMLRWLGRGLVLPYLLIYSIMGPTGVNDISRDSDVNGFIPLISWIALSSIVRFRYRISVLKNIAGAEVVA